MRLLVVEDNAELSVLLGQHFRDRGVAVDCARCASEAFNRLAGADYGAMILDLGLPDMDGLALLRHVRAGGRSGLPTLILTARDRIDHRVAGLDAGADDYILKPFDIAELEARLRAVLRRSGLRGSPVRVVGDLHLDAESRSAASGARHTDLTGGETALLEVLIEAVDRVVVRDVLFDRLFVGDVSANAAEAVVSRLRRKLDTLGSAVRIETVRGIGYRLRVPDGAGREREGAEAR